jgi:hypothetical protein
VTERATEPDIKRQIVGEIDTALERLDTPADLLAIPYWAFHASLKDFSSGLAVDLN